MSSIADSIRRQHGGHGQIGTRRRAHRDVPREQGSIAMELDWLALRRAELVDGAAAHGLRNGSIIVAAGTNVGYG